MAIQEYERDKIGALLKSLKVQKEVVNETLMALDCELELANEKVATMEKICSQLIDEFAKRKNLQEEPNRIEITNRLRSCCLANVKALANDVTRCIAHPRASRRPLFRHLETVDKETGKIILMFKNFFE